MSKQDAPLESQTEARTPSCSGSIWEMDASPWTLGDARLRIAHDGLYPGLVARTRNLIAAVHPDGKVHIIRHRGSRCVEVGSYWRAWPVVFPQHGLGRKHHRRIVLEPWQLDVAADHPQALVRGLLHSDGCRFIANQRVGAKTYRYARYSSRNRSEDILSIFCRPLDALHVHWTRPNRVSIAVDRRTDVSTLDAFVGPKY